MTQKIMIDGKDQTVLLYDVSKEDLIKYSRKLQEQGFLPQDGIEIEMPHFMGTAYIYYQYLSKDKNFIPKPPEQVKAIIKQDIDNY